jgi:hypothetical protein
LDRDGKIVWGTDVDAVDLHAAVDAAREHCRERYADKFGGIEVWQGAHKLYPPLDP